MDVKVINRRLCHWFTVTIPKMPFEPNDVRIEVIPAPAGVPAAQLEAGKADIEVHLPDNMPMTFRLKLGRHKPLDWVGQVEVQTVAKSRLRCSYPLRECCNAIMAGGARVFVWRMRTSAMICGHIRS